MLSRANKLVVMKIISLFSVVRGYNIPIIILAQYLSAIFILAPEKRALNVLLDFNLFILVFASALTIASGYIINNFYDSQKDLINRPNKSMLDRLVSQKTKLSVYFTINFIVALMALFVSWRAFEQARHSAPAPAHPLATPPDTLRRWPLRPDAWHRPGWCAGWCRA